MAHRKPRIGITCCIDALEQPAGTVRQRLRLNLPYIDAVAAAGGLPVPLPAMPDADLIAEQIAMIDGLLVTGGLDVPPARYWRPRHPKTVPICDRRADFDLAVFAEADKNGLPILGICLGHQIINVARGGTLIQHLADFQREAEICHSNGGDYPRHVVRTQAGSLLRRIIPEETVQANSSHHQAIEQIGTGLVATAWAPDGIIEGIEDPSRPFLLGVQWHPEVIVDEPAHAALFSALVGATQR